MNKSLILGIILLGLLLTACENVDLSKVNKEDVNKVIVCEKPYMRFASGCCMDQNENKVCDTDETKKEGTASSTTISAANEPPESKTSDEETAPPVTISVSASSELPEVVCGETASIGYKSCQKEADGSMRLNMLHWGSAQLEGVQYYLYDSIGNQIKTDSILSSISGGSEASFILPALGVYELKIKPIMIINGIKSICQDYYISVGGSYGMQLVDRCSITASASFELTPEESNKALSKLDFASKSVISTPSKVMNIGETYVFGVGIVNVMPKTNNFKVVVHFKEAKSTELATPIEGIDDNMMLDWIGKSKLSIINLDSQGKKVIPLVVEVLPEIGPGKSTVPGSYVFDIDTQYETGFGWETYALNTITVIVG